jgi:hypothetical protein
VTDPRLFDRLTTLLGEYAVLQQPGRCDVAEVGFNALAAERDRQHAADLAAQFMNLALAADLSHLLTPVTA